MLDDLDIAGLWFFGAILAFYVAWRLLSALARYIDRTSPLNRDDRRQLRTVSRGKRAQRGFKSVRQ